MEINGNKKREVLVVCSFIFGFLGFVVFGFFTPAHTHHSLNSLLMC